MKLLLDTCVWGGAADTLRAAGHDVRWMGDDDPDPGDAAVMQLAVAERRILITLDKDFGELAIVYGRVTVQTPTPNCASQNDESVCYGRRQPETGGGSERLHGRPHCGIIRLVGLPGRRQGAYCVQLIECYRDELDRGAILTATADRVRIRAPDA